MSMIPYTTFPGDEVEYEPSETAWRNAFGRLTNLRSLSVDNHYAVELCAELGSGRAEQASDTPERAPLWPLLGVLQIRHVSFPGDAVRFGKCGRLECRAGIQPVQTWRSAIRNAVQLRRALQLGPHTLSIRSCLSDVSSVPDLSGCGARIVLAQETRMYPNDSWRYEDNELELCAAEFERL